MNQTSQIQSIGIKIKNLRLEKNLSQEALLNGQYSKSYLSRVETEKVIPSFKFLDFLAARFGMSVAELIADTTMEQNNSQKMSHQAQEYLLMNAHIALESHQPEKTLNFLKLLPTNQVAEDLQAVYYATLGEANLALRHFEPAVSHLEQALTLLLADENIPPIKIEQVRNLIGLAYYRQNKDAVAISYHLECLKAIDNGWIADPRFELKIYYNLANEYAALGNVTRAIQMYHMAAKLGETGDDNIDLAGIYWGLGMAHQEAGELGDARRYLQKSASLYERMGCRSEAVTVKNLLGRALIEQGQLHQAEIILKSALNTALELADDTVLYSIYINLAYYHQTQQNISEAEQNARTGLASATKTGDKAYIGQALAKLAEVRYAQNFPEESIQLFDEAVTALSETDTYSYQAEIYFRYAKILESMGNLKESLKMMHQAYNYRGQRSQNQYP